ncbi:MAG: hypothetical protein CVU11_07440 [Bacteroidetes bacterium HGW-Bacteroidetes-6]|jgi:hypothetical protein|nr:MAG: hypothetical protein CVU11_07440 [Bacteroidetes bacterium HGW-Bacteroidetes-6]
MKIDKIPGSIDEFIAMRDMTAHTPEGGLACFIVALHHFSVGHPDGLSMMIICRDINDLSQSNAPGNYKGYTIGNSELQLTKMQLGKQNYIPASYFAGSAPENNYTIPQNGAEFIMSTNAYSGDIASGRIKIYVLCSGAATPRPATMVVNDKGIWKVKEYSSLITGIQAPRSDQRQDNL